MTTQHARPPRHRRLLAAALTVASIATLATVATGPAAAAAPRAGSRADVPWQKVGTGWNLATWAKSASKGRPTLFLVAPDGHRYTITTIDPHLDLVDWSPDGRRVLVGDRAHEREIDLHTGHSHVVRLPADSYVVSYTRPKGHALLIERDDRLQRVDLQGRHQKTYPANVRGAGNLFANAVLETPDGTELVVGAAHGLVLLRNNGSVVRRLMPKSGSCRPVSWSTAKSVQVSCGGRIWSAPLSGARAHPLTAGANKENPFGYNELWRYGNGQLGLSANGCGPSTLVRFGARGNGHRITVTLPSGKHGRMVPVGHHGDIVNFLARPGRQDCMSANDSLLAYDAVTHRSKALLGPGVNGGTVMSVRGYPIR